MSCQQHKKGGLQVLKIENLMSDIESLMRYSAMFQEDCTSTYNKSKVAQKMKVERNRAE